MLSTATTGVKPELDELIAVSLYLEDEDGKSEHRLLVRQVTEEARRRAEQYHKLTAAFMAQNAIPDSEFTYRLHNLLDNKFVYTYNSAFQRRFLEKHDCTPYLLDVVMINKVFDSGLLHDPGPDASVYDVFRQIKELGVDMHLPSFKDACAHWLPCPQDAASLPVEQNAWAVRCLWQRLFQDL